MSRVVLLTGGIATGKTFVSDYLATLGAKVIDTDQISRIFTSMDHPQGVVALEEIRAQFGEAIFEPSGQLNRRRLRELVFSDDEKLHKLESILHPKIEAEVEHQLQQPSVGYHLLVVPVLSADSPYLQRADYCLAIELYASEQTERLMKRDRISHSLAMQIIDAQISRLERRYLADDIILNHYRHNTIRRLNQLHQKYMRGGSHS